MKRLIQQSKLICICGSGPRSQWTHARRVVPARDGDQDGEVVPFVMPGPFVRSTPMAPRAA